MKQFLFVFLLCSLLLKNLPMLFAEECWKNEVSVDGTIENQASPSQGLEEQSVIFAQSQPVFSPEVENLIQGTELSHAAGLPDPNESVEALSAFLEEMKRVKQSIKKRMFGDEINTEGLEIDKWLTKGEKNLLKLKEKYPESRHIYEGLARIYQELYEYTKDISYLEKASNSFIQAEELGTRYGVVGVPHYVSEVFNILVMLSRTDQIDNYFMMVSKAFPTNEFVYLNYAKALSNLKDKKADEFFKKAISLRLEGDFQPIVDYVEYLLDREMYKEAIEVLNQLSPSEDYAYYPHFLRGFALEKIGQIKNAETEYKKFLKFYEDTKNQDASQFSKYLFRVPSRYRIPGSPLQKNIFFKNESKNGDETNNTKTAMVYRDTTPYCMPDDWICKATYYIVWTINGEAEQGGGTIGMMRAIAWNMRTRVFWNYRYYLLWQILCLHKLCKWISI